MIKEEFKSKALPMIEKYIDYLYEHDEEIADRTNSCDVYEFSVTKEGIRYTSLEGNGSHWARFLTYRELDKVLGDNE